MHEAQNDELRRANDRLADLDNEKTIEDVFFGHRLIEADADVIEADLEVDYQHSLWLAGGADGEAVAAPRE